VNPDDRRLISEALAGRTASFGELVHRYQDRLYNVALRVSDQPEDAADVLQEAFVSAYLALPSFKGDAEFFTWLYRITFNTAISWKRKKRQTISLDSGGSSRANSGDKKNWDDLEPMDKSSEIDPSAKMERADDERILAQALKKLSDEHRVVLVFKDIDGLKYEEIAEILKVPVGTIRSRLHRARLELRLILDPNALGLEGVEGQEGTVGILADPEHAKISE
jgi:RNA polymerase sigma-70 factor (ECF subfamily)